MFGNFHRIRWVSEHYLTAPPSKKESAKQAVMFETIGMLMHNSFKVRWVGNTFYSSHYLLGCAVVGYQCFGGPCCLHLPARSGHGVTTQKIMA
jgi:hypothetical protein